MTTKLVWKMFEKSGSINYYILYKSLEAQDKKVTMPHNYYPVSKPDSISMNIAQN